MLKKRVITALWGLPLVIVAVWFSCPEYPFPLFSLFFAVWGVLAALEFYRMTGVSSSVPLTVFGLVAVLLFITYPHCTFPLALPVLLTATVVLSLFMIVPMRTREGVFARWAWMVAGVIYIGWLLSLLVRVRLEETAGFPHAGRNLIFLVLFSNFASDTMAFFIGKAFGRHKLAPQISPGKTWEGAFAGLCGGIIVGMLFALDSPLRVFGSLWQAGLIGGVISIFGQLGDLAESLLKRNTGVKDSGSFLAGHGGFLDRLDSVLLAGVVVFLYRVFVAIMV
ncbi:MAG: phosphatidate cytidylyltransferase [Dehalococcoidales bacterium]|nr:phosphatidate cytidylyltransferase [Dehalococcoidales bacterium]